MITKGYIYISGFVFFCVALMHLYRATFGVHLQIGNWIAPQSISWGGFVVTTILFLWAYGITRKKKK